ncbi:MAG: hypothetical protein QM679_11240 [Patulibacter sp.]
MRRSEPGSAAPVRTESRPWWTRTTPGGDAPSPVAPPGAVVPPSGDAPPSADAAVDAAAAVDARSADATFGVARGPRPVAVTVWQLVDAPAGAVYAHVVASEPASLVRGGWLGLTGGSDLQEHAVVAQPPGLLRSRLTPTRGLSRCVLRQIDAQFVFSSGEAGGTVIRWSCVLRPRRGARTIVVLSAPLWRRVARQCVVRLADGVGRRPAGGPNEPVTAATSR